MLVEWADKVCIWKGLFKPALERGSRRFHVVGESDVVFFTDEHGLTPRISATDNAIALKGRGRLAPRTYSNAVQTESTA